MTKLPKPVRKIIPNGTVPRAYIAAVILLALSFIIAESYIMWLLREGYWTAKNNQWQVEGVQNSVQTSMTAYQVYNAIYILSQVYMVILCLEAVATENFIQIFASVGFYFVCLVYAVARYIAFYLYPTLTANIFLRDENMHHMQLSVIGTYVAAIVFLAILSWKLKTEVGWSVYKKFGADNLLHRSYKWYQILMLLLKLDIFFVVSYLIQMSILVLKVDNPETWIQMTVFIPFSIGTLAASFYSLRMENRSIMRTVMICYTLSVGYFIFKIYRVCRAEILNKPGDPYQDSRPYFMITIVATMLLVIASAIVSLFCIRNFDNGLKEAIEYEKMKRDHHRAYNTN
ncbi:hypothetical protein EC988_003093, partial [Linderina pennispora]